MGAPARAPRRSPRPWRAPRRRRRPRSRRLGSMPSARTSNTIGTATAISEATAITAAALNPYSGRKIRFRTTFSTSTATAVMRSARSRSVGDQDPPEDAVREEHEHVGREQRECDCRPHGKPVPAVQTTISSEKATITTASGAPAAAGRRRPSGRAPRRARCLRSRRTASAGGRPRPPPPRPPGPQLDELVRRAVEAHLLRRPDEREQHGVDAEVDERDRDRHAERERSGGKTAPVRRCRTPGRSGTISATARRWSANVTAIPIECAATTPSNSKPVLRAASVRPKVARRPATVAATAQCIFSCAWRTGWSANVKIVKKAPPRRSRSRPWSGA